jgi:hypothetical protein
MRPWPLVLIFFFCVGALAAQMRIAQPHASALGFSYSLPADWQVVDTMPSLPGVKQKATQSATSEDEKKGVACVQVELAAWHGDPRSFIEVMALPFDCFGSAMADGDLPEFVDGVSKGLRKTWDLSGPVDSSYTLGRHAFWVERAKGTLKSHPENTYTIEFACTLLQKATACWIAMAADANGLQVFESGAVELEGEPPCALVPPTAFARKPS